MDDNCGESVVSRRWGVASGWNLLGVVRMYRCG